ncbi:MAG TPA: hypothetical protein VNF51_01975 [Candidatus Paceibacterota bacterium]|nr:hypothetical protein [Candidatus Paceibacterota bacterium]
MQKIKDITLFERRDKKGTSWDKIHILDDGRLNFDSHDLGSIPMEFWGHEDYEYDTYVDAEWKDSILLLLRKERFKRNEDFRKWADTKEIPYTSASWP